MDSWHGKDIKNKSYRCSRPQHREERLSPRQIGIFLPFGCRYQSMYSIGLITWTGLVCVCVCMWIPEYFRDGELMSKKNKDGTLLLDVSKGTGTGTGTVPTQSLGVFFDI